MYLSVNAKGLLVSFAGPCCAPDRRADWCLIKQEAVLSLFLLSSWAQTQPGHIPAPCLGGFEADPPSHTAQLWLPPEIC